jgi:hypothetical protein
VEKQEPFSRTFDLAVHLDIVELNTFPFHAANYGRDRTKNNLENASDKMNCPLTES